MTKYSVVFDTETDSDGTYCSHATLLKALKILVPEYPFEGAVEDEEFLGVRINKLKERKS